MSQQKTRKKRGALYAPISVLVVFAAVVFGLSIFFRVSGIAVEGNALYSPEEIVEASGIEEGDNLFFINRFAAISRIFSKLPYIEKAGISRSLPNKVVITVSESKAVAYVTAQGETWAIDRSCKLLSRVEGDSLNGLIRVDGVTPQSPEAGQPLKASAAETPKIIFLTAILTQMQGLDLRGRITYLDMTDITDPVFDYDERFIVKLGANENVEYKFQCLLSAVDKLSGGDRGTLDLSIDSRVHLTYD